MANIGFIGLGIMGKPMTRRLIKGGHTLFLYSRSGVPEELLKQGGNACPSPVEVAENSDVIITMLPEAKDVEQVLFGDRGIACGLGSALPNADLHEPKTIVDMSSISPIETRHFAERIGRLGCHYMDAPVSGGDIGARNGTLTIMVGASEEVFQRVLPVLELMGQTITRIGNIGSGQICKISNQIIVALTIEAVGEGLLFASKAGADPVKVREALLGGFAASRVLDVHGGRMIRNAFEPGFRVELHQKDLGIALSNARAMGISLPNTASVQEMFNACVAHGDSKLDSSAVVKVLEKLANHEIQPGQL
ncbi:MAG TPA: 2-hydroxy-3-oxopropionate reductase [Nitrosospira sp.]|nr:2-hydroxy-3-oxopropionate reductase [Nitrosospira sp.]